MIKAATLLRPLSNSGGGKMLRIVFFVLFLLNATVAVAGNFVSLHQSLMKIALPPAVGAFTYTYDAKIGFQQQYSPVGASGCAMGFGVDGCAFRGGGALSLPEFTGYQMQYKEFKIFVPAGTKTLFLSGYAPQNTKSAFALRFGAEPVRIAALSDAEYTTIQATESIGQSFSKLIDSRQELLVVHDGGGSLRFVAGSLIGNALLTEPNWLYIRQLSGSGLYDYQGGIDVDLTKYAEGYSRLAWSASTYPDPLVGATPGTGTGTTPTPTPTPPPSSGGLSFTPATLFKDATTPVTISGVAAGATCRAYNADTITPSDYVVITDRTILPKSAAASLTSPTTAYIRCGSFDAGNLVRGTLSIVLTSDSTGTPIPTPTPIPPTPIPPTPTGNVVETTATDGTLTLSIPLTPALTSELSKSAKVWVAARWSSLGSTFWSFKTAAEWKDFVNPNPELYAFSDISSLASTQNVLVPLGLPKSILNRYGIEIHTGYQTSNGTFTYMGKVWP